ncbi:adhesion G protein-coupled receptor E3-like, partial [Clarias magur]
VLVCVFGPKPEMYFYGSPYFVSVNVSVKINPVDLPKMDDDSRSSAMAFMSYVNVADTLKPSFFSSVTNANKITVMSTVVSATLPKTTKTDLSTPANFTLRHITPLDCDAFLFCMDWETNAWDSCFLISTRNRHSVCSCKRLTTFALISQTDPCR